MANQHRFPHRYQSVYYNKPDSVYVETASDAMEYLSMTDPPPMYSSFEAQSDTVDNEMPRLPTQAAVESLTVEINWIKEKPCLLYQSADIPDVRHPCILQFAFSSNRVENAMRKLKHRGVVVSCKEMKCGRMHIDVNEARLKTNEEVLALINSAFCSLEIKEIDYLKFHTGTKNFEILHKSESDALRERLRNEELMLFCTADAHYLVGKHTDLKMIESTLHLQMHAEKRIKDIRPWSVLETLEINQYLIKQNIHIDTQSSGDTVTIKGIDDEVERAEEVIRDFDAAIKEKQVHWKSKSHSELLSLSDHERNDSVFAHFEKQLRTKKVPCFIKVGKSKKGFCITVLCKNEQHVSQAADVICCSVSDCVINSDEMKEIETLVEIWKGKRKLVVFELDSQRYRIICTSDIKRKIEEELHTTDEVKLPTIIRQFLKTHGKKTIVSLMKKHHLEIDIGDGFLHLRGTKKNVQRFKEEYRSTYAGDIFDISIQPGLLRKHGPTLASIAYQNECCYEPKFRAEPKDSFLKNCKTIATWCHAKRGEKVTLIAGEMEDIETDFRILFVTDNLFPLSTFPKTSDLMEKVISMVNRMECKTRRMGEILDYTNYYGTGKPNTKAIVLSKSNKDPSEENMSNTDIEAAILKVLNEAVGKGAKTIVVPFCLIDENMPPKKIAVACTRAMMSLPDWGAKLNMYLICGREENEADMAQFIDDMYQETKATGYYRDVHSIVKFNQDRHNIKVQVMTESLTDMKTDVIVNTVATNLKLTIGKLSKQILEKAGKEVQAECESVYPDGIKHGEYAITSAGKLESKLIFHCALPPFDKKTFIEDIKSMVRRCLLEMDMTNKGTIAFPGFGTGKLGYPVRETAKAMFDAVEEYTYCSIKSNVEMVVFVMIPDETEKVFCREEARRMSGYSDETEDNTVFPCLSISVGEVENKVQLKVARICDVDQLNTTIVKTQFTRRKDRTTVHMIPSSLKKQGDDKDILDVCLEGCGVENLKTALHVLLDVCDQYRIFEILILTSTEVDVSDVEQIKVTMRVLEECSKRKKTSRLANVYMVVPDIYKLEVLEEELNKDDGHLARLQKFLWAKHQWKMENNANMYVKMRVVGNTLELVQKTIFEIKKYLMDMQRQDAKTFQTGHAVVGASQVKNEEHEGHVEDDQIGMVSAKLNPGICKFLVQTGCFEQWMSKVQACFSVHLANNSHEEIKVTGTFERICDFEKYLDEDFPRFPGTGRDTLSTEAMDVVVTDKNEIAETEMGQIHNQESKTSAAAEEKSCVLERSSSNSDTATEELRRTQCERENKKNVIAHFSIDGIDVSLIHSDITKMTVDCIVSSANENLVATGLAGKIASAAGNKFRQACREELNGKGQLKVSDCRLMDAGNLSCKNVLHVMGPSWSVENQIDSLRTMNATVMRCLQIADQNRFSSVALPLICSGDCGFPVDLLAQEYVRALQTFSKNRKCVQAIYVVEINRDKIGKVMTVFKSQTSVTQTLTGDGQLFNRETKDGGGFAAFVIKCHDKVVKINVVVGNIQDRKVDAAVSTEDRAFTGTSTIAKSFIKQGGQDYRNKRAQLQKNIAPGEKAVCSVIETEVSRGQLLCQYVLHTVVPRRNKQYCRDASSLERDVSQTVQNVLCKATNLKCQSVAMPLFGISEQKDINTPVETCCKAMVASIYTFLETQETTLAAIEFVCVDAAVVRAFYGELEEKGEARR